MISLIKVNGKSFNIEKSIACPHCKNVITPNELFSDFSKNDKHLVFLWECPNCYKNFMSIGSLENLKSLTDAIELIHYPTIPTERIFDDKIKNISNKFVNIYNQAKAAEEYKLDEIAGIGYRKSLEFLIKDYCISIYPNDKDKILDITLSQTITKYIDDNEILKFAKVSTWLGNDETHYIRKFTDKDINDLKIFIDATIHYISLKLLSEEADSILSSKQ